jgi:hypothetical protein
MRLRSEAIFSTSEQVTLPLDRDLSRPQVKLRGGRRMFAGKQAGLRVFFEKGSWYATWTRLEEALFQPVEQRWTWLRIEEAEPGLLRFRDGSRGEKD